MPEVNNIGNQTNQLGAALWSVADSLRGKMNADNFRDYMLSFLFLRYLSNNYEEMVKQFLGSSYPKVERREVPLEVFYQQQSEDKIAKFEAGMKKRANYILKPKHLWGSMYEMARTQNNDLLKRLEETFKFIEEESFGDSFRGLFGEVNLSSDKLGKDYSARNQKLCEIITILEEKINEYPMDADVLGDAYEYLIGQFAAGSGKKAGEFYTPQPVSTILSRIVTLDCQNPSAGRRMQIRNVLDFACGSGSLLLNVSRQMGMNGIGHIYGQENNITTYNLARMNMLLHGKRASEFSIFHGDTLKNEWEELLNNPDPSKQVTFDAVVANPPFSLKWKPTEEMATDARFENYGVAPKSHADYAFLLHGFHYLSDSGTMAIVLPHGVLFRVQGGEGKIREKLLHDDNIDCVIGLPKDMFHSTNIPVCILVLKKCRRDGDVLFINAAEHYEKLKKYNRLRPEDIDKIIDTYQYRKEEDRYSRRVSLQEIKENDYNLNITRYVSLAEDASEVDLEEVGAELKQLHDDAEAALKEHNGYLRELGLDEIE